MMDSDETISERNDSTSSDRGGKTNKSAQQVPILLNADQTDQRRISSTTNADSTLSGGVAVDLELSNSK